MKYSKSLLCISIILLAATLSSCTTLRANMLLLKQTTPQEKAEMLFEEGLARYNDELLIKNKLKSIPTIRRYFSDALKLDPQLQKAHEYINKIDVFKYSRFSEYKRNAENLLKKDKRTDTQDYSLVLAVKLAGDIRSLDFDLINLKNKTGKIRTKVIDKRINQAELLEQKIVLERNPQVLSNNLRAASDTLEQIENIDPSNKKAEQIQRRLDNFVATLAKSDIDDARTKLAAKKYAEAESAILKAEKSLMSMTKEQNPQIRDLKYQVYISWGNDLLASKKYQSAGDKASLAVSTKETPEALTLKTKIAKAASQRDYDADIENILASVDLLISRGDLSGANTTIQTNLSKLKNKANRNALSAKNTNLVSQMDKVYQEGISLYNQEDYVGARKKFRIVIKVDPEYEQAQAYIDRSDTKIRALTGKD